MLATLDQPNLDSREFEVPPGCKIFIDDKEIKDLYPFVKQVKVNTARLQASDATVEFQDVVGYNSEGEHWMVQDDPRLIVGAAIKLVITFNKEEHLLFTGFLGQMKVSFSKAQGQADLTLECQDETLKLDQNHKTVQHQIGEKKLSDGEIVKSLLRTHGVQVSEGSIAKGLTCDKVTQTGSPIQLINARARANGFEFYIENGVPYFGPMRLDGAPQGPDIKVQFGGQSNCIRFQVTTDVMSPTKVFFEHAQPEKDGKIIKPILYPFEPNLTLLGDIDARGEKTALGQSDWFLSKSETTDLVQAKVTAQFKINEASMRIKANGELDGLLYKNILRSGQTVKVVGAGERNSGIYYVDTVEHKVSAAGYTQNFKLLRNAISTQVTLATKAGLGDNVMETFNGAF